MSILRNSLFLLAALVANAVPASAQVADSRDLSVQQQEVANVTTPEPGKLAVSAWVDHENNRYDIGETIQLSVKVSEDAYLTVVSVGPSGNAVLLYPNAAQPGALVKGGDTLVIPGDKAPAQIVATAPAGNELIRVIASSEPLQIVNPDLLTEQGLFKVIEGGANKLARDLAVVVERKPAIAFYDKVIKTLAAGNAELEMAPVEPPVPVITVPATSYGVGDTVPLSVAVTDACTLWVVNVSSDGSSHLLFPNKLVRENALPAASEVVVSGGKSPVKVVVGGPAGQEAVYALCSESAMPPWQAGLDFAELFPQVEGSTELGKALLAVEAGDAKPEKLPGVISWSRITLTVTD